MRSLSVGLLVFLLGLVCCGHKNNHIQGDGKEDSAGCVVYQKVCQQVAECRTHRERRCFTVTRRGERAKRSPGLLQALLLHQALRTRHPERAEERREVRCHLLPARTSCHNNNSQQPPVQSCSVQPVNIC